MWKYILVSLWFIIAVALFLWLGSQSGASKTYEARCKSRLRHFLLPGQLANKEVWIRFQRVTAYAGIAFFVLLYVLIMISIA